MAWNPLTRIPWPWSDAPSTATPLDAADLKAADQDQAAFTTSEIQSYDTYAGTRFVHQDGTGLPASVENAQSVAAGNMGSTYALTLAVGDTLLTGTLNAASCTITPAGPAGSSATLHLTQDVTGGRLVVISGAKTPNGAGITLSSAGSKTDVVVVWTPDGVNFYAQAGGLAFA